MMVMKQTYAGDDAADGSLMMTVVTLIVHEHEDADDDDSSDDGISISSETKRLMRNDPLKGACLNKPERNKVMDLPLAIIGKESDGGASS